ncbi:3-hydroxypropanoate dehydrogenase [Sphingomonas jinjuensis]|uniref:3-hydroxypropanoate dehydrogenase n=1 Tax=Sphingomonas jinjuensis TaxID=535907 RepID=A0A840F9X1_9SPHN|nr:malonic semialdehyde reductase [Sphingomonas jinjuensis]MBB4153422.1 3-hydroxypropanoate dehydrogenase [Sphingomonas jinjuensis]
MPDALPDTALDQLFRTARTFNGYTDAPVTEADIRAIYELAKMGPTATNQHPGRFIWCTTPEAKEKLAALASDSNAAKVRKAPATVIIAYDKNFHEHLPTFFPHVDARPWFAEPVGRERSAQQNANLQAAYLILAARSLGFDTGPMAGFDAKGVDAAFFADQPDYHSIMIMTVGHGDPSSIQPRLPRPPFDQFNTIL